MPIYKFLLKWASVSLQIKEGLLFLQMGAGLGFFSIIVSFTCSFWLSPQNGQAQEAFAFQAPPEGSTTAVFGDMSSFSSFSQVSARREPLRAFLPFSVCEVLQEFWIYFLNSGSLKFVAAPQSGIEVVHFQICSRLNHRSSLTLHQYLSNVIFPSTVEVDLLVGSSKWAQITWSLAKDPKFLLDFATSACTYLCRGFCRSVLHAIDSEQQPTVPAVLGDLWTMGNL